MRLMGGLFLALRRLFLVFDGGCVVCAGVHGLFLNNVVGGSFLWLDRNSRWGRLELASEVIVLIFN